MDYSKYSDKELVQVFQQKKSDSDLAFTEVYNRYAPRLHAYCLRTLGDKQVAEDIFQETFIKFYDKVKSDYNKGSINGFLITIARNLCLNHKRNLKPNINFDEYDKILKAENIEDKKELTTLITQSLDILEFNLKEPLVLRMYEGLSYKEIAEICQISVENARKRVSRAKQKMKEILKPYYYEI